MKDRGVKKQVIRFVMIHGDHDPNQGISKKNYEWVGILFSDIPQVA